MLAENPDPTTEKWRELCLQAAVEKDPQKLLVLTREINRLLLENEQRLEQDRKSSPEWAK